MNENDKALGSVNLNAKGIWLDIETCLLRICKYLDKNKLGLNIKDILEEKTVKKSEKHTFKDKFSDVFHLISNTVKENKSEEINSFFIEFFRLSALFYYSINEENKALELLDYYIVKINEHIEGLEEEFHDKNLLIERDRMLINKAQILFWEDRIYEANEIIDNRINYLKEGVADEYYLIKMTFFYSTLLSYKAWIYFYDNDEVEADKAFYLSIKLVKDLKRLMKDHTSDLRDLHKRQIKLYDQYSNFLIFRDRKQFIKGNSLLNNNKETNNLKARKSSNILAFFGQPNNYLLWEEIIEDTEFNTSAFKFLKEILKIMTKESEKVNFFDEELPESLLIYYNLFAGYFCLSVVQNETINLENTLYYLINAYILTNKFTVKLNAKLNGKLLKKLITIKSIAIKYGKVLSTTKLEEDELIILNKCVKKLKQLIILYEDDNSSLNLGSISSVNNISKELGEDMYFNKILDLDFEKNQAEANLIKFSADNKKNTITENINEVFIISYICEKFNYCLACNILQDKKLALNNQSLVLQGMNGFLIIEENSLTLIVQNSVRKNYNSVFGMNNENFDPDENPPNTVLELLTLKSNEFYFIYYSKHLFNLKKEHRFDLFGYLVMLSFFDSMGIYKPAILVIEHVLTEMTTHMTLEDFALKYPSHYQLYVYLSFLKIKYYFKLEDFSVAFQSLMNISRNISEYSWSLFYFLLAIILSKQRYMDLSAVFFEKSLLNYQSLITSFTELDLTPKSNNNKQGKEEYDNEVRENKDNVSKSYNKIDEDALISNFVVPVKMFLSVGNMMKLKVITDFIKKIDLEKEKQLMEVQVEELNKDGKKKSLNNGFSESIAVNNQCFYCGNIVTEQVTKSKSLFSCNKCRRASYCSKDCYQRDKNHHLKICDLYYTNLDAVNHIITCYILQEP
jgi:hypothetical protein